MALAAAAALVVATVGGLVGAGWTVSLTGGWGAAALVTVLVIWLRIGRMGPAETAAHAQAEDYSRAAADFVFLSASVGSLVTIGYTLVDARHHNGADKALLILLAVAVVALSWTAVHLIFTVRYGGLYYAEPVGGVTFNEDEDPDYKDFLYFALTIGMTFQVSDTNIGAKPVRRQVTRHALLSYVFGAVIVALAINTVATLLQ